MIDILSNPLDLIILLALFDTLFHAYIHVKWNISWFRWLFYEPRKGWLVVYRPVEWGLNAWALWHIWTLGNPYHFWAMVAAILLMTKDVIYVVFAGQIKDYIEFETNTELRPSWLNYGLGYFLFSAGYRFNIEKFFIAGFVGLFILIAASLI